MLAVTKTDPGGVKSGAHQALGRQRWVQGEQDRAPVPRNATLLLPGGHSPDLSQGLEIPNDQLLRQRITPYLWITSIDGSGAFVLLLQMNRSLAHTPPRHPLILPFLEERFYSVGASS